MRTYRIDVNISAFLMALTAILFSVSGCSASKPTAPKGFKYQYSYSMLEPQADTLLSFRDASLRFHFAIDEAAILMEIENTSKSPVMLDWSRASITVDDKTSKIRNSASYSDEGTPKLSTYRLAAGRIMKDFVMPSGSVTRREKNVQEVPLFPTMDLGLSDRRGQIQSNLGRNVNLEIPVEVEGSRLWYSFTFQVVAVNRILWKDYKKPERFPGKQTASKAPGQPNLTTTVIVSAGMIGIATAFLIAKKNPRED